jgi:hypothetical protein
LPHFDLKPRAANAQALLLSFQIAQRAVDATNLAVDFGF